MLTDIVLAQGNGEEQTIERSDDREGEQPANVFLGGGHEFEVVHG